MDRKIVIIADRRLNGVSDMREILFKAKRLDNGEWVEGDLLHTRHADVVLISDFKDQLFRCDGNTLCQYTGLTDKNGKKIWENDIVRNEKGDIGVVQWFEEHAAFMIWNKTKHYVCYLAENDFSKIEIAGNIFDNAELLEVK